MKFNKNQNDIPQAFSMSVSRQDQLLSALSLPFQPILDEVIAGALHELFDISRPIK